MTPDPLAPPAARRFITLDAVAEMFSISKSQAYALVRTGDLAAIKIGGRGLWRIDVDEIEAFIERGYAAAAIEREAVDSPTSAI